MKRLILPILSIFLLSMCTNEDDPDVPTGDPKVNMLKAEVINGTTVSLEGELIDGGGGMVHSRGFCLQLSSEYCLESSMQTPKFSLTIDTLQRGKEYNVKAYAENDLGDIGYSESITFTTFSFPSVRIDSVYNITIDSAYVKSAIVDDGGTDILSKGVCWNTIGSPTVDDSLNIVNENSYEYIGIISHLLDDTDYYVRAFAENSEGIIYSNEVTFKTLYDSTIHTLAEKYQLVQAISTTDIVDVEDSLIIPAGSDVTQIIIEGGLFDASPCQNPENNAIEMRDDGNLFFVCIGNESSTPPLDAGSWSENSELTTLIWSLNSTVVPPVGFVLEIRNISVDDNGFTGNIGSLPIPDQMLSPYFPTVVFPFVQMVGVYVEYQKVN